MPLRLAVIAALLLATANQATAATSEHLVFISNRDGDRDVYAVNPDGSHLVALTRNKSFERAELSPDGRRLVVARSTGTFRTALVAVTPDGRHERVLASGENVGLDGFSRDGRWIGYHQGPGVRVVRSAWRAGTSKTLRFQFIGPCDGQPNLLYGLNFTTPGVGWHRYFCTDHCYDTPTGASVRNPGEVTTSPTHRSCKNARGGYGLASRSGAEFTSPSALGR